MYRVYELTECDVIGLMRVFKSALDTVIQDVCHYIPECVDRASVLTYSRCVEWCVGGGDWSPLCHHRIN